MAVAHIQSVGAQSSGTVASIAVTFAGAGTAGNLIVAAVIHYQVGVYTVTDGVNVYIQKVSKTLNNDTASIWGVAAGDNSTLTITVTNIGGNKYTSVGAAEFSGVDTVTAAQTNSNSGTSTTPTTGSVTSVGDGALYVAALAHDNGTVSITPDGGFTEIYENESASNEPISVIFKIQTSAGALNPGWTFGSSVGWPACVSEWEAAAGGGTTRGTPFGHRGTAFNGGRTFHGIIQ